MARSIRVGHRIVSGYVKRVATFTITIAAGATTGTATIQAVNMRCARLVYQGFSTTFINGPDNYWPNKYETRVAITNETTVTATRGASDATYTVTLAGTVVEYWPGVLTVQRGTVAITSGTSGTTSISEVNLARSFPVWLGYSTGYSNGGNPVNSLIPYIHKGRIDLQDSTTVRAQNAAAVGDLVASFEVETWA